MRARSQVGELGIGTERLRRARSVRIVSVDRRRAWLLSIRDCRRRRTLPTKGDEAFMTFVVDHMGIGFNGLILAAVLAATMSNLSSSFNSSASSLMSDWLRPLAAENGRSQSVADGSAADAGFGRRARRRWRSRLTKSDCEMAIVDTVLEHRRILDRSVAGTVCAGTVSRRELRKQHRARGVCRGSGRHVLRRVRALRSTATGTRWWAAARS